MAELFLFSCTHCQKQIEISVRQAGNSQNCPFCESVNSLPGMREIRQLPASSRESDSAKSAANRSFSEARSWLFSGGLLVAVIAGLFGFALASYANSIAIESTVDEKIAYGNSRIGTLPPGQLWDAWDQMTESGLPDWQETRENRYNKQSGHLMNFAYGLYAFAGIGLFSMIISFFLRRR